MSGEEPKMNPLLELMFRFNTLGGTFAPTAVIVEEYRRSPLRGPKIAPVSVLGVLLLILPVLVISVNYWIVNTFHNALTDGKKKHSRGRKTFALVILWIIFIFSAGVQASNMVVGTGGIIGIMNT